MGASILGEPLPFEEKIIIKGWPKNSTLEDYKKLHRESLEKFEEFWASVARELEWLREFSKVYERGDYPHVYRWFPGGLTNISYLALDRHVKGARKNKVAYIWEGEPVDEKGAPREVRKLTYYDLWREVNRVAYILSRMFNLKKGDKIAIYLPMIPELPIFMLAAARLGVIFTVVFAGFTAENLATRINDLGATLLVTADGFYRRGKIVRLKDVADKAVEMSPGVRNVIVVRRLGIDVNMVEGRDYWLEELMEGVPSNAYVDPVPVESEHTLYVLYTSGTTGKPKGIIHDHGGYAVLLHATMKWVFDIRDDDVYYCTADIGWVTGHSYIVFGPLIEGATIVMYEGAPDYPGPDRWWSIVERYGVTVLYTTPTAVRMLMRFGDMWVKKHDRSTLRLIHSVGEPINPSAWRWLYEVVGESRCPVGSTWWMTETGGILISIAPGLALIPIKPGANGLPLPGIEAEVVDDEGKPVEPGMKGFLVITRPWPGMPAPPTGMWGDPERYEKVYWSRIPGFFYTGDYAIKDSDGYIWVLGRADEVLKVAGHRIGTYELESVLVSHPAVSEAAVVGAPDPVKGEVPVAYVVLKEGQTPTSEMAEQLKKWVREKYGPIATPQNVFFVSKLPKTRSGKIMRRLLVAILSNKPLGDVTTLEDEAAVDEAKKAYEELSRELKK
ncbi:MAG: acetate--CoA ligase [Desulfurococcales archaeon]|nr:acetate--CoA ligase [Desulfurococcales archaeon]